MCYRYGWYGIAGWYFGNPLATSTRQSLNNALAPKLASLSWLWAINTNVSLSAVQQSAAIDTSPVTYGISLGVGERTRCTPSATHVCVRLINETLGQWSYDTGYGTQSPAAGTVINTMSERTVFFHAANPSSSSSAAVSPFDRFVMGVPPLGNTTIMSTIGKPFNAIIQQYINPAPYTWLLIR